MPEVLDAVSWRAVFGKLKAIEEAATNGGQY